MNDTEQQLSPTDIATWSKRIQAQLDNSRPTSWYELRITRDAAEELLLWDEARLSAADEILARNDRAKREAASQRAQRERFNAEVESVIREMKQAEEDKLRAKAEKVARQRLGLS